MASPAVSPTIESDCSGTFDVQGRTNLLVAQLGDDGDCNWLRGVSMSMTVNPRIDANATGLYVAGGFSGTLVFPLTPQLTGGSGAGFVARYGPDGAVLAAEAFPEHTFATALEIRFDEGLVVAGGYFGTVDMYGTALTAAQDGLDDVFVARLDKNALGQGVIGFGGVGQTVPTALALATGSGTRIAGIFQGTFEGADTEGGNDMFVVNVAAGTGEILSQKTYGTSMDDGLPWDIALTPALQTVVVGELHGPVDFGAGPLPADLIDAFAIQLGQDGITLQKSIWWGESGVDRAYAVAIDGEGSIIIGGSFEDTILFYQDIGCTGSTARDAFVVKLDSQWIPIWVRCIGGAGDQDVTDIVIDDLGRIAVAGSFTETIDLDVTHTSAGGMDLFVAVLAP